MNPLEKHKRDDAFTPITLSDIQKQAMATALREARQEAPRYRQNPENVVEAVTAAKTDTVGSRKFIL